MSLYRSHSFDLALHEHRAPQRSAPISAHLSAHVAHRSASCGPPTFGSEVFGGLVFLESVHPFLELGHPHRRLRQRLGVGYRLGDLQAFKKQRMCEGEVCLTRTSLEDERPSLGSWGGALKF